MNCHPLGLVDDPRVGEEVRKLKADADAMLEKIIRELETAPSRDQVLREHRITPETFFRWKKRRADEAKRSSDGKQDVATMAPHPLCGRIRFPRPVRS